MICKSNHGSSAPELAHPSSRREDIPKGLTNPVGIQLPTQAAGTQLPWARIFTNAVPTSHEETWSGTMSSVCVAVLVFEAYAVLRPPDERTTESVLGIMKIRAASPSSALR